MTAYYSSSDLYYFTSKLYALMRNEPEKFHLKKLGPATAGKIDWDTEEIFVDPRHEMINTLIHEVLHRWHPDWCETKVLEEERKIMTGLSDRQIRNIVREWGENV